MRRKYDSNDAVMAHQAICNRLSSSTTSQILEEYFSVCREHSDSLIARNQHQKFAQQVEAMRMLLTTQRPLAGAVVVKSTAQQPPGSNNGAPPATSSSTSYPRTQFSIIPPEWTKEHYKKLVFSWNQKAKELSLLTTEAIVAWLLKNQQYEHFGQLLMISDITCYSQHHGVVFQKWSNIKDAKNFVQGLHLVVNAPLSRFMTPFAFAIEILGQPVVAMTLAPVEQPWHTWRQTPLAVFHVDILCATTRLFFATFIRSGADRNNTLDEEEDDDDKKKMDVQAIKQAQSTATYAAQNATVHMPDYPGMELMLGIGTDARWYIIDGRSFCNRQPYCRQTQLSQRLPRRETMFSPGGVMSTPYSPNEFILRFKLKIIAEQLLVDPSLTNGVTGLVSTVMHQHGVRFGPFVFTLFLYICEQERQFKSGVTAANRRNGMTPAAQTKIARFTSVKQAIIAEIYARIVKQLLREELLRVEQSKSFLSLMTEAVSDAMEDDDRTEQIVESLNAPLIEALNLVLSALFTADATPSTPQKAASPAVSGSPNFSQASNNGGLLGITPLSDAKVAQASKFLSAGIEGMFFDDIVFMINDKFVNRVYSSNELQSECRMLQIPYSSKFEISVSDVDVSRVLSCVEQLMGITLVVKAQKYVLDASTNFFESFFNLDDNDVNPLRSEALLNTIELPLCLTSGVRSKMLDFVSLQQRVAAKLSSMIDPMMTADVLHYSVSVGKAILLYANDVTIAHRGYMQEEDFDDVTSVHQQISCPPSAYGNQVMTAFDASIHLRVSNLMASTDLQVSLRRLMKYTETTRSLYDSAIGTAFVLADKVTTICKVCEKFVASGLVSALETALGDLNMLTVDPYVHRLEGQSRQRKSGRHAEIKTVQSARLQLLPLSLLVRHVMMPDTKRTQGESLAAAVKYCTKRRDLIVEVYGEKSLEAGIACNDIAAICSNNKFDFDRAEEEFERAVFILNEVEPTGASLQITKNNLAFLCFRKAERLRKQNNVDSGHKGPQARAATNAEVNTLLAKAKMLLTEVMDHEQKLPVLDFAAALNNLASIKLFESKFDEAKKLFTRTLEITARLGDADDHNSKLDLPCRVHALRNLKVLARRQYLSAVMRVQAAVRRFVTRIRERKNFAMLRAIKPIQRVARGHLTRLFLAKHYRFSAFHSWLRKPRLFTRKLDVTFQQLPVEARVAAWNAKLAKGCKILQRVGRGVLARRTVGKIICFLKAHFEQRRPLIIHEIIKRRIALVSAQLLRWKLLYGCEQFAELCVMCQLGVKDELRVIRTEAYGVEARAFRWLFLTYEQSLRAAIENTRLAFVSSQYEVLTNARFRHTYRVSFTNVLLGEHFVDFESQYRNSIELLEKKQRFQCLEKREEQLRFFQMESRLRQDLQVEAYTKFVRPEAVRIIQVVAQAYQIRKMCAQLKFLPELEHSMRQRIVVEEHVSLNRTSIRRQLKAVRVMEEEERERSSILEASQRIFRKQPGRICCHETLAYCEWVDRNTLELKEIALFQTIWEVEGRWRMFLDASEQGVALIGREAIARKNMSTKFSDEWLEITEHDYRQTNAKLIKKHVGFALAITQMAEQRQRQALYQVEGDVWTRKMLEPFLRETMLLSEDRIFNGIREQAAASLVYSQVSAVTRERHLQRRLELEQRESNARYNVLYSLETVGRGYIVGDLHRAYFQYFVQRCQIYSAKCLLEWYQDAFVEGAKEVLLKQIQEAHVECLEELKDREHHHMNVTYHLIEARNNESDCRQLIELDQRIDLVPMEAASEKIRLFAECSTDEIFDFGEGLMLQLREDAQRTQLARSLTDELQSLFAATVLNDVLPTVVSTQWIVGWNSIQRESFVDAAMLSRESTVMVHERASRQELLVDTLWAEIKDRTRIHRDEAVDATSIYFLFRHAHLVIDSLMPKVLQFLDKRHNEIRSIVLSKHRRVSAALWQRVGRAYLRRVKFGAFHFREVVAPLLLIQAVGRGFTVRRRSMSLCQGWGVQHLLMNETERRSTIIIEEEEKRSSIFKASTSFTGTQFLRTKAGPSVSSALGATPRTPKELAVTPREPSEPKTIVRTAPRRAAPPPFESNRRPFSGRPQSASNATPSQWRSRLFSTPAWQTSALFQLRASQDAVHPSQAAQGDDSQHRHMDASKGNVSPVNPPPISAVDQKSPDALVDPLTTTPPFPPPPPLNTPPAPRPFVNASLPPVVTEQSSRIQTSPSRRGSSPSRASRNNSPRKDAPPQSARTSPKKDRKGAKRKEETTANSQPVLAAASVYGVTLTSNKSHTKKSDKKSKR